MKGTVETSMIGILGVILATVILFVWASHEIFSFISQTFSEASAENVARQLSSFMTVSGASYMSRISYTPTKKVTYNIQIKSRVLNIAPNFNVPYAEKSSSTHTFATNFSDYSISDVNFFNITKRIVAGEEKYEFSAKKE